MFQAKLINPLIQYGRKTFDLVLEDTDGDENGASFRMQIDLPESATDQDIQDRVNLIMESLMNSGVVLDNSAQVVEIDMPGAP